MLKIKNIVLVALLMLWCSSFAESKFSAFQKQVNVTCQNETKVGALLAKKVLIELLGKQDCSRPFSSKLLAACDVMTCQDLVQIWRDVYYQRSGSVIGGQ